MKDNASFPVVVIKSPSPEELYSSVSSRHTTIKQADGTDLPFAFAKAVVTVDYNEYLPVTVELTAVGGFEVELAAGLRIITLNGKRYQLVEAEE